MAPQNGTTTDDEKNPLVKGRFLVVFSSLLAPRIRIGVVVFS